MPWQYMFWSLALIMKLNNIRYNAGGGFENICDRILENGSKSHMKSIVFLHIFNCISTNAYVFPEYLLHKFDNLSIKFHVMI